MQSTHKNEHGQPVGPSLPDFKGCPRPSPDKVLVGPALGCRLEPLDLDKHGDLLVEGLWQTTQDDQWTYMPYSRPSTAEGFKAWLKNLIGTRQDPFAYAIIDAEGKGRGTITYLNIVPANGTIEVGHVLFSSTLQRSQLATEVQYMLAKHAFEDLGYRRLEWKCDAHNARSQRAARRLGYEFEGIFRKHWVYKGRSRDTAWFSIVDDDWPRVKRGFEAWLAPDNFDEAGAQRRTLEACRNGAGAANGEAAGASR